MGELRERRVRFGVYWQNLSRGERVFWVIWWQFAVTLPLAGLILMVIGRWPS